MATAPRHSRAFGSQGPEGRGGGPRGKAWGQQLRPENKFWSRREEYLSHPLFLFCGYHYHFCWCCYSWGTCYCQFFLKFLIVKYWIGSTPPLPQTYLCLAMYMLSQPGGHHKFEWFNPSTCPWPQLSGPVSQWWDTPHCFPLPLLGISHRDYIFGFLDMHIFSFTSVWDMQLYFSCPFCPIACSPNDFSLDYSTDFDLSSKKQSDCWPLPWNCFHPVGGQFGSRVSSQLCHFL